MQNAHHREHTYTHRQTIKQTRRKIKIFSVFGVVSSVWTCEPNSTATANDNDVFPYYSFWRSLEVECARHARPHSSIRREWNRARTCSDISCKVELNPTRERGKKAFRRHSEREKKMRCNLNNTVPEGKHHLPDRMQSVKEKQKYNNKHTISLFAIRRRHLFRNTTTAIHQVRAQQIRQHSVHAYLTTFTVQCTPTLETM